MVAPPQPGLGTKLRALRTSRGLSVRRVAETTGLSPSFLSLVETGKSDITIGRLTRLVEFYGVSLMDLVPGPPSADARVVRQDEQRLIHSTVESIDFALLVPDAQRMMMPMLVTFAPGARLAEYGRHPGEEWVHVLEGELTLELEGEPSLTLAAGDSAYYSSTVPHSFANASSKERLIVVCVDTPPNI
jgi:quercetin dioxygenase-like cupin family protein